MTQVETRNIGFGIAASLALHFLVFLVIAILMTMPTIPRIVEPKPQLPPEPEVTLLYAKDFEVAPPLPAPEVPIAQPVQKSERYIRTTQNDDSETAPKKADFISDRNTVASAKLAGTPDGNPTMPTGGGTVDIPTMELANRDYKDGEIKQDSAPSGKPALPTPPPAAAKPEVPKPQVAKVPEPPKPPKPEVKEPEKKVEEPKPLIAKKDDSPSEKMMRELDDKLKDDEKERLPLEVRPPMEEILPPPKPILPDEPPQMQTPDLAPVMKAEPVAEPLANTPKPEKGAFQPQTRVSKLDGGIQGGNTEDSVNAAASLKGRYMRQVTGAIEKKWHYLSRERSDAVQPGRLRVLFRVNKDGKIKPEDVKILYNKANPLLTDFTLTAILQAEIPPIPKDLLPELDDQRVEIEYEFVIY